MKKIRLILSAIVSAVTASLGIVGLLGLCCTLTGAAILSALGLASLSGWLFFNNKWLFLLSGVFLILTIILYINYKTTKTCQVKGIKKKNI